ncbi:hypothetical protein [Dyella japonica]|uniref:Uncharacterized protein n=1 Tax=Dyella japonica TaxID=231455 RepID=A0ABV2K116_9GAMM
MTTLRSRLSGNIAELTSIWIDIARAECFEFLEGRMTTVSLDYQRLPRRRAVDVIESALRSLSAERVFKLIYMSVENAAAFTRTAECKGLPHAINCIPRNIEMHTENCKAGKYNDKPFRRPKGFVRSTLSHIFFSDLLGGSGDIGFRECVTDYLRKMEAPSATTPHIDITGAPCEQCGGRVAGQFQGHLSFLVVCELCGSQKRFALVDA